MAAGQQKKRLSSSNLHEQYKGKKKKKLDSLDYTLNLRPHIHLEWDDSKKQTLAKREQIGIRWRDMAPFVDDVPQRRSGLADVLSVPQEIFGLENLKDVLSYEVWENCLSESERKYLMQFLPNGPAIEQVVHSVLEGDDHHFVNPCLKWASSLCSGDLHPDNIRHMDRQFRTNRKAYYSELNQYHAEMIELLKNWKEKWASCRDPEKLKRGLSQLKRDRLPISAEKGKVTTNFKKEVPHKICARIDDTAKYMSYIKITKKQLNLVKNLKHGGDGILSKSLDRVIGDISGFSVHPYEGLEEVEKIRLHEHWLHVVKKDLPRAFEEHRGKAVHKEEWGKVLEQELVEKRTQILHKGEMEDLDTSSPGQIEDDGFNGHPGHLIFEDDADSPSNSSQSQHLECIPSHSSCIELNPVNMDQEAIEQAMQEPTEDVPIPSHLLNEKQHSAGDMESSGPALATKYTWEDGSMQNANYLPSSESHPLSFGELSLRQPHAAQEGATRMIDFESDILEHGPGETIASALHMDSTGPLFYPYARQNHDVLPPFPKETGMLSAYQHQHINDLKQPELELLMANESLSHSGQFPHQFQEHQQLVDQRHNREQEMFMQQVMHKNVYSNGRYPTPGHMSVESHGMAPLQPSLNGVVGHNWFPQEHRAHSGWSGIESNGVGQCSANGGVVDGSLFSVLSGLPSRTVFGNSTAEMPGRNLVRGGIPNNDGIYGFASHQIKSSNSHEIATNPTGLNMSWLNYPHPNSSMHDSNSKPFMGSWKQ